MFKSMLIHAFRGIALLQKQAFFYMFAATVQAARLMNRGLSSFCETEVARNGILSSRFFFTDLATRTTYY